MEEKKEERLEFRGGSFFAVLPLILFVVVCIMLFVVFKVFEMEGLCMGGILVLIIGSLFAKNWGCYWRAVVKGMKMCIRDSIILDPERPMAVDPLTNGALLMEYRYKHLKAQQAALEVIEEVDREYGELFGRSYGCLLYTSRCV